MLGHRYTWVWVWMIFIRNEYNWTTFNVYAKRLDIGFHFMCSTVYIYGRISCARMNIAAHIPLFYSICTVSSSECVCLHSWFSTQYHHFECIRCIDKKSVKFLLISSGQKVYEIYDLNGPHSIPKCWIKLFTEIYGFWDFWHWIFKVSHFYGVEWLHLYYLLSLVDPNIAWNHVK